MDKKSVHFKDLKKDCKYNIYDKEGVAVYGNPYLLTIKSIDNKHAVFRTLDECYTEEIKPYDPVIFSIEELGYRYVLVEEESAIDHGYLSFSELEKDKSYDWYFNDRGNITPMICNPHKVVDRSEDQIVFLDSKGKYDIHSEECDFLYKKPRPVVFDDNSFKRLCVDEHGNKYKVDGETTINNTRYWLLDSNIGTEQGNAMLLAVDRSGQMKNGQQGSFKLLDKVEGEFN